MGEGEAPKVRVDPPEKFDGRGKIKASTWMTEVERWMRLSKIPWEVQVDATASRLKGGALTWLNSQVHEAAIRGQSPYANWAAFRAAFLRQFEPMSAEEVARGQIRAHTQTGNIQSYVYRFRELRAMIPSMNTLEAYNLFVSGLQPQLRQMVGTLVAKDDLEAAIDMAQRSQAYGAASAGRQDASQNIGRGQQKGYRRQKHEVNNLNQAKEEPEPSSQGQEEVNFAGQNKKKTSSSSQRRERAKDRASSVGEVMDAPGQEGPGCASFVGSQATS